MRWLLLMIAVGAAGTAGYFGLFVKNSFSGYSNAQLDVLERELTAGAAQERPPSKRKSKSTNTDEEQQVWAEVQQRLLLEERQRRLFLVLSLGVAALSGLGAAFVRGKASTSPVLTERGEDARLVAAVGDPAVLREGARQKAASLLGVSPDAPPAVIEAALQAQLQQRDPSLLVGLGPDLKQLVLQQREELTRARDVLLEKSGATRGKDT
ncbi:hypothetical protein [Hyalangium rubrum]|uniref:Uncharacterized protein n=1 Tax=Hyalangium rubrum TaxID=3103134 RepID=A0ABU5H9U3_9BACT|nr:hypothetical protein [Hyalangium sp. s54d21]MDY7230243.1 hypothetical protein [Hyalangium sp. s54d21]